MAALHVTMVRSVSLVLVFALGCTEPALSPQCSSNPIYSMCGSATGPMVEACCTLTTCELRVADGHVYPCDGTDCTGASAQLSSYCGQLCAPPDTGVATDGSAPNDAWVSFDASTGDASDAGLDAPLCLR
jgi:hypothetical protein